MEGFRFRWSAENLNEGAGWIALGLFFKMCLADNLAVYFNGSVSNAWRLIWLNNLLFGLRIYYDFAGYSLIAVGLGRCLGVKLTLNFLSPYCSTSMVEFWRRWHVTLSQWFRDYVYIKLGGGRVRWLAFNVALVFIVSGIGTARAAILCFGRHPRPGADHQPPVPRETEAPWLFGLAAYDARRLRRVAVLLRNAHARPGLEVARPLHAARLRFRRLA